jgi:2-polyprenyl-3-methyl-5-hydroxy-6-metoxy-1,4-benzoquinol methylase
LLKNTCKICNTEVDKFVSKKILNKYQVDFFRCSNCKFIQPEKEYWLEEAYSSAIASLDIGLVYRNLVWRPIVKKIIKKEFNSKKSFLDYGGGYGLFVRLMRDEGLDFYRQDIYCENKFAQFFDIEDVKSVEKFELLTAFEVFEHLVNPIEELEKMFRYSDSILFSTELQPDEFKLRTLKRTLEDWHYFTPETGQHIALYSLESLHVVAKKFNKNLYSDGNYLHLLTSKKINPMTFMVIKWKRYLNKAISMIYPSSNGSLIPKDYEFIKAKTNL